MEFEKVYTNGWLYSHNTWSIKHINYWNGDVFVFRTILHDFSKLNVQLINKHFDLLTTAYRHQTLTGECGIIFFSLFRKSKFSIEKKVTSRHPHPPTVIVVYHL